MDAPDIPTALEGYREPVFLQCNVAALILRGHRPMVLLDTRSVTPEIPHDLVAPGGNRIEMLKELMRKVSKDGSTGYRIYPAKPFAWKKMTGGETDYFFINGLELQEEDGYRWYPLTDLGLCGLLEREESSEMFSQAWSVFEEWKLAVQKERRGWLKELV
ncbi:hypothetical protein BJX99DRAFT_89074 [Aspergillus californicus]